MKRNIIVFLLIQALLSLTNQLPAQGRYSQFDDDNFTDAFLYLVYFRGIPDSIYFIERDTIYGRIPFPEAVLGGYVHNIPSNKTIQGGRSESSNYYVIRYPCADSNEGGKMLSKVRELIARSLSSIGFKALYKGTNLYFSDSNFIMYGLSLRLSPPGVSPPGINALSTTWEVILSIELANKVYSRLGYGVLQAKKDPSLESLLKLALGTDKRMLSLKNGPGAQWKGDNFEKANPNMFIYASKKTLPGFKARIVETRDTVLRAPLRVKVSNRMELKRDFIGGSDDLFLKKTDSLLARMRGSVPSDYCYRIDPQEYCIYFRKLPWLEEEAGLYEPPYTITLKYISVENVHWQLIIISRGETEITK